MRSKLQFLASCACLMTSSHLLTRRGRVDAAHLQLTHCRFDDPCAIAGLQGHQNSDWLLLNLQFCRIKKGPETQEKRKNAMLTPRRLGCVHFKTETIRFTLNCRVTQCKGSGAVEVIIPGGLGNQVVTGGRRDSTGAVSVSPPCRYNDCEVAAPFRSITHTLLCVWVTDIKKSTRGREKIGQQEKESDSMCVGLSWPYCQARQSVCHSS